MIPILIHVISNLITLGSKGGVVEAASAGPTGQVVVGMLAVGTLSWVWGGFLLWKAGKRSGFVSPLSGVSTI